MLANSFLLFAFLESMFCFWLTYVPSNVSLSIEKLRSWQIIWSLLICADLLVGNYIWVSCAVGLLIREPVKHGVWVMDNLYNLSEKSLSFSRFTDLLFYFLFQYFEFFSRFNNSIVGQSFLMNVIHFVL